MSSEVGAWRSVAATVAEKEQPMTAPEFVWVKIDRDVAEHMALPGCAAGPVVLACREALAAEPVVVVSEATARAWMEFYSVRPRSPEPAALYDELAAQLAPPKPRYEVIATAEGWCVTGDEGDAGWYVKTLPDAEARARALCAELNGEPPDPRVPLLAPGTTVVDKNGTLTMDYDETINAMDPLRHCDEEWPEYAPHRFVLSAEADADEYAAKKNGENQ